MRYVVFVNPMYVCRQDTIEWRVLGLVHILSSCCRAETLVTVCTFSDTQHISWNMSSHMASSPVAVVISTIWDTLREWGWGGGEGRVERGGRRGEGEKGWEKGREIVREEGKGKEGRRVGQ